MPYQTAPTLVATAGDASANTYATLAEAETYHTGHPHADTWAEADALAQTRALLLATRLLDAQVNWQGAIATLTQALGWPRLQAYDRHDRSIGSTEIPQRVKDATCEYARWLLARDRTADRDSDVDGLKRVRVEGVVEVEFRDADGGAKVMPDAVWLLLTGYGEVIRGSGRSRMSIPLARV